MHRLLVDSALLSETSPSLPKDAARHLKVLRPKDGEAFELFDGKGAWRTYSFSSGALSVQGELIRADVDSRKSLTLFACVTKGSRWDWTIEKSTELGVTRIVPVVSARTIVRIAPDECAAKRERWMRIAEDAARQSNAKWIPEILPPMQFAQSLPLVADTDCFIGALTKPTPRPLLAEYAAFRAEGKMKKGGISVFVGPEGDFTPDELAQLLDIGRPVTFGPSILRAETAAIFAVGVLGAAMQT